MFDDPRADGLPVYFADIVVAVDRPEGSLSELTGARFAYNDTSSLSGYLAVLAHLGSMEPPQFAQARQSGSSDASLALIAAGEADVCSVDSVVWRRLVVERPELLRRFRVLESLGPFPIQPVVASSRIDDGQLQRIADALLSLGQAELHPFGAIGFAPIGPQAYEPLALFLSRL